MADLQDLARRMRRLSRAIPRNASSVVSRATIAGLQTVVSATPVDTGRARGNWFVQRESPSESFQPARRDSVGPGVAAAQSIGEGEDLHLTNNAPYINRLNDGSSAQAPAGFVEDAVTVAAGAVAVAGEEEILKGF